MTDRTRTNKPGDYSSPAPSRGTRLGKPRQMKGSPFDQTGCWFCGAQDTEAFTDEYGWYEEMISESGGVSFAVKSEINTYMPIGQRTVKICSRCIAEHTALKNSSNDKLLLWITVSGLLGAFVSGIYFGLFDWMGDAPVLDALYFPIADVWHHDNGNHILMNVLAFAITVISMLMLVPAAAIIAAVIATASLAIGKSLLVGKTTRRNRKAMRADRMTNEDRRALRSWSRDLGAAQLTRDNAEVDPFFLFHPDTDDDGQRHIVLAGRKEWVREYDGAVYRHWIEHRRPHVDNWEIKPMPRTMVEDARTLLTHKGLKPPGGRP